MDVLGHGIDLVQVARMERMLGEPRGDNAGEEGSGEKRAAFLEKVFTLAELRGLEVVSEGQERVDLSRCAGWQSPARRRRMIERIAARFAGKEAVMKALGTGLADGISWQDVEIVTHASGAPGVALHGRAREIALGLGMNCWLISLTHTHEVAMASVITGRGEGGRG